jgi:hypothetical protein
VGTATAWRYVNETVALLAARAPKLRKAVRDAKKAGHPYVVIDGTLIPIDRVAADRPFYSGKHRRHGMNLQVIASPHGDILWVSGALPGSVHDKKAEWIWGVLAELEAAGLVTLATGIPLEASRGMPADSDRFGTAQSTLPLPASPHPPCRLSGIMSIQRGIEARGALDAAQQEFGAKVQNLVEPPGVDLISPLIWAAHGAVRSPNLCHHGPGRPWLR